MTEEISKLVEILREEISPKDLSIRLRSDSLRTGLELFYSILDQGIQEIEEGKLMLESWTQSQVQTVLCVARSIVSSSRAVSGIGFVWKCYLLTIGIRSDWRSEMVLD